MKNKQQLVIILPEFLEDLPIQIIRSSNYKELAFTFRNMDEDTFCEKSLEQRHVLIWRKNDYLKVSTDEILWVEADGSYSNIYLTNGHIMTVSSNLAVIEKELPPVDFMRIHRSRVVNLKHVISLIGNSLKVGDKLLTVGREYREKLLDRFIFLGVRRKKEK